jgi:Rieske Fe-S protein
MTSFDKTKVVALPRRTVLAAGGVVAVGGVLVACGGEESAAPADATTEEAEVAEEIGDVEVAEDQGEQLVAVSEVPVEGGVVIPEPPVVVVQPTDGDIKAFSAVCPHQGCLVSSVEANEIFCPCHGSLFSAEDGAVLAGPANSGLPAVAVRVQDDSVFLG